MCCLHISVCTTCITVPEGSRRKTSEPLEKELQVVVSCPVSAKQPVLLTTESLLGLSCYIYSITLSISSSPLPLDLFLSSCNSQLNPHTTLGSSPVTFALSTVVSCSSTGTSGGGRSQITCASQHLDCFLLSQPF